MLFKYSGSLNIFHNLNMLDMVTFCLRCQPIKGHFTQKLRNLDHPDKQFFSQGFKS